MSKNMVILRVEKIKGSKGDRDLAHIRREYDIKTLTNPGATNYYIRPPECKDISGRKFKDLLKERLKPGYKPRRDCIKGFHIVFSFSPGAIKEPEQIKEFCIESTKFFKDKFGSNNFVECIMHCDESSIHCHYITQVVTSDGKLRAKDWINGPESLRQLQTEYHQQVGAAFGLCRGLDKRITKRKHQKSMRYFASLSENDSKLSAYQEIYGDILEMEQSKQEAFIKAFKRFSEEPATETYQEYEIKNK